MDGFRDLRLTRKMLLDQRKEAACLMRWGLDITALTDLRVMQLRDGDRIPAAVFHGLFSQQDKAKDLQLNKYIRMQQIAEFYYNSDKNYELTMETFQIGKHELQYACFLMRSRLINNMVRRRIEQLKYSHVSF